ncbi:hypothetical protein IMG5_166240, partial [Ichthyophthirius multifiliis]
MTYYDSNLKPLFGHSQLNQPSRYGIIQKLKPITYNPIQVLEKIESQIEEIDIRFKNMDVLNPNTQKKINQYAKQIEPEQTRIVKVSEFKVKPLKRNEYDYLIFKDIFVYPQEERLNKLKISDKKQRNNKKLLNDSSAEQFYKDLKKDNEKNNNKNYKNNIFKLNQYEIFGTQNNQMNPYQLKDDKQMGNQNQQKQQKQFFDQLIQVQPPDQLYKLNMNTNIVNSNFATSIPLTYAFDENNKSNIQDLLILSKSSQQTGDVKKEAHIYFYLGVVYDNQKNITKHYNIIQNTQNVQVQPMIKSEYHQVQIEQHQIIFIQKNIQKALNIINQILKIQMKKTAMLDIIILEQANEKIECIMKLQAILKYHQNGLKKETNQSLNVFVQVKLVLLIKKQDQQKKPYFIL